MGRWILSFRPHKPLYSGGLTRLCEYKKGLSIVRSLQKCKEVANQINIIKVGTIMKETGIVRRIDDLGRVVIPREIRRTLHINEGDAMEIYLANGGVLFKKYDTTSTIKEAIENLKKSIIDYGNGAVISELLNKVEEINSLCQKEE